MYVHLVFAVQNRDAVLHKGIRDRVFEYISGILKELNHKPLIVNGVSNHIHMFFSMNPAVSVSDTVYHIKRGSSLFINKNRLCIGKFSWQEGYDVFTYSKSQIEDVYNYIAKQEEHHRGKTFREEYLQLLNKFDVDYDERFLFDFF